MSTTIIVCLVAMMLIAAVVTVALLLKGNVRAGGKIGPGSFFIETTEKRRD
jgi:hypothetical protein